MNKAKPFWQSRTFLAILALVVLAAYEPAMNAIDTGDWRSVAKVVAAALVGAAATWARSVATAPLGMTGGPK